MVRISVIDVTGNKRTKNYIILREIPFKVGDSMRLNELPALLQQGRTLVYNTTLFTATDLIAKQDSSIPGNVQVNVVVKEKWYIYPAPLFQPVDRNINEWIKVYNADLNRVIYGARFAHYNFSGRRDVLKIILVNGYARNLSFSYSNPYSNKKLTEGFSFSTSFTQNREISFNTGKNNKLQQFNNGKFVRNALSVAGSYFVRRGFYKSRTYFLGLTSINVLDTVFTQQYNPLYFNGETKRQTFPDLAYVFRYSNTDNINYPLKGKLFGIKFTKRGLGLTGGINMLSVETDYTRFIPHGHDWYSTIQLSAITKLPFKQAYINRRGLGYADFGLRGMEYYVIDGVATSLAKYTLRKKIAAFDIRVPIKNKFVQKIPVALFAKTYADAGYSYLPERDKAFLNNRLLYSGGFGLDILTFYDMSFRLEYSFNQLNEKGLFLHVKGAF